MEQQHTHSAETDQVSEETMSSQAASEAIAIANQQEKLDEIAEGIQDAVTNIDDMLDDIDKILEEESVALNYRQKGGQ